MKEKILNSSQPGEHLFQDNSTTGTHGNEESQDQENSDQQEDSADEYDNYAPWG